MESARGQVGNALDMPQRRSSSESHVDASGPKRNDALLVDEDLSNIAVGAVCFEGGVSAELGPVEGHDPSLSHGQMRDCMSSPPRLVQRT